MKKLMYTNIPKMGKIELSSWYKEFEWYYPNCEMETKRWLVENIQSDWNFLDCGANIGYYAILFSRMAPEGHVWAIEPTETERMLIDNLSFNKINNVTVHKLALGNKSGKVEENIYRKWGCDPEKGVYEFTTIDEFVYKHKINRIDCIKIDVDSFDFEVLQGAVETLKKMDPVIVVELNYALHMRNQSNIEALEWMCDMGYQETLCLDHENFIFQKARRFKGYKFIQINFPC